MSGKDRELERLIEAQLVQVNAAFFAIVAGLAAGLALFLATNWLVLKAGSGSGLEVHGTHHYVVGPHLALLSQYFVGYKVTFLGSLIGFVYAFVCAGAIAYGGAWLYNWVASLRHGHSVPE